MTELVKTIESDDEVEDEELEEIPEKFERENAQYEMSNDVDTINSNKRNTKLELIEKFSELQSFSQLALSRPLLKALKELKFTVPTPIQTRAIPEALKGQDICGSALTGSGKTAAYLLPILERLIYRAKGNRAIRALILTPTRELAAQVSKVGEALAKYTDIQIEMIVGGMDLVKQSHNIRAKPDIVVATPGRLIDHVRNTIGVDLDTVEILVLDESDRLLEMGFQEELYEIIKFCPAKRQTMLFSATMTTSVTQLADLSLNKPIRISVDGLFESSVRLRQEFVKLREAGADEEKCFLEREATLLSLCSRIFKTKTIIFFKWKKRCHRISFFFKQANLRAEELHGDLSQTKRLENLKKFTEGKCDFLLCTDVASRGLDIKNVETVINFELPKDITTYVHRVGRTARAGRGGVSVTLTTTKGDQRKLMKQIVNKSKTEVKLRKVDTTSLLEFKEFVSANEEKFKEFLADERVERNLERAEQDAQKIENIAKHGDEIFARPKRTWFQSSNEKELLKVKQAELDADKDRSGDGDKSISSKFAQKEELNRKKRKRLESLKFNEELRKKRNQEKSIGKQLGQDEEELKAMRDAKVYHNKLRKEKEERERELNDQPIGELSGLKVKTLNKPQSINPIDKRHKDFSGKDFKEIDLALTGGLRKGGKLSKHSFKSKSKYKRR